MAELEWPGDLTEVHRAFINCVVAIIVDLETQVIIASTPLADEFFGYIHGELPGMSLATLIPPSLRTRHDEHFANYAKRPRQRMMGNENMQLVGWHRDEYEVPVVISLYPQMIRNKRCTVATIVALPTAKPPSAGASGG